MSSVDCRICWWNIKLRIQLFRSWTTDIYRYVEQPNTSPLEYAFINPWSVGSSVLSYLQQHMTSHIHIISQMNWVVSAQHHSHGLSCYHGNSIAAAAAAVRSSLDPRSWDEVVMPEMVEPSYPARGDFPGVCSQCLVVVLCFAVLTLRRFLSLGHPVRAAYFPVELSVFRPSRQILHPLRLAHQPPSHPNKQENLHKTSNRSGLRSHYGRS